MTFADDMQARLGPLLAYDPDRVGEALCAAFGAMDGGLYDIVQDADDGPGWSMVLSPDRSPTAWLPWTGALFGVNVTTLAAEATQREEIRQLPAENRGTTDAMVAALKRTLTGNKSVLVNERVADDAYQIQFVTRPSETDDYDKSLAALLSQKPGALALTLTTTDSPVWNATTLRWNEVADGVTWNNAEAGDI